MHMATTEQVYMATERCRLDDRAPMTSGMPSEWRCGWPEEFVEMSGRDPEMDCWWRFGDFLGKQQVVERNNQLILQTSGCECLDRSDLERCHATGVLVSTLVENS